MIEEKTKAKKMLPDFFKPLFWSYNFSEIDSEENKRVIVVNTINYGDLKHWRWLVDTYGKEGVRSMLKDIPATELRARVRRLAGIIFNVNNFNYAPRGTGPKK